MDDRQITAGVLRYLLEHKFESRAEMARRLDILPRTLDRVFEKLEVAKGGTVVFNKAISYCAQNHISLDLILTSIMDDLEGSDTVKNIDSRAFEHLNLSKPERLTADGEDIFMSMLHFLRQASTYVCPNCRTWCNPWDGKWHVENMDCYIGHMAREIVKDVSEFYTQGGDAD